MKTLVFSFCGLVNNISHAFEGTLGKDNPEIAQMKQDILSGNVPGIADDRENLRQDGRKIVSDVRVAYEEYLEAHGNS